ncbi:hypothetical protein AC578_1564 [Pseudocercospora eumusae]|uniref:Uncharacterized protein n=1 Tax=Pseudocercospora eumusae TaxID=321146 RepID=A0A139HLW4_9PEZI|nr:hypothetical protein AC578_1564 [Pseudocercospora eumusae]
MLPREGGSDSLVQESWRASEVGEIFLEEGAGDGFLESDAFCDGGFGGGGGGAGAGVGGVAAADAGSGAFGDAGLAFAEGCGFG